MRSISTDIALAVMVVVGAFAPAQAARRALLVGISVYEKPRPTDPVINGREIWRDLKGAVNDVEAMRALLIQLYGFRTEDVAVLTDGNATRGEILKWFRGHLVEPSGPGDVAFFFFAGHGSQVANSLSKETDGLDETLVPADARRGARDIRDKELRRLFNDIVDRGAALTVVVDSCHSGSIGRGPRTGETRGIAPDRRDIAPQLKDEPADTRPDPASRPGGAVILSASQDYQVAIETEDGNGTPHGAFSLALQRAIRGDPNLPVVDLFERVRGLMKADGLAQEPKLEIPKDRHDAGLLGRSVVSDGAALVSVSKILGKGEFEIQGGRAIGMAIGTELALSDSDARGPVRLTVTAVRGLASSIARIEVGNRKVVRSGDLLRIARWVPPDESNVKVWIPPALEAASVSRVLHAFVPLLQSERVQWVTDPSEIGPSDIIQWNGTTWELQRADGTIADLGTAPDGKDLLTRIEPPPPGGRAKIYLDVPPTPELEKSLLSGTTDHRSAVERVPDRNRAHYVLSGRIRNETTEWAWVHRAATVLQLDRAGNARFPDSGPLPRRSDWVGLKSAGTLTEYAHRLGVIRGWFCMPPPPQDESFPYRLQLQKRVEGKLAAQPISSGDLTIGEEYELVLTADPARVKDGVLPRFVYVFVIDQRGRSTLVIPNPGFGGDGNRYPSKPTDEKPPSSTILTGYRVAVGKPPGIDAYIMLASFDALPNPWVLEFDGIQEPKVRGNQPPLAKLLRRGFEKRRSPPSPVPADWSLQRLYFRTVAR